MPGLVTGGTPCTIETRLFFKRLNILFHFQMQNLDESKFFVTAGPSVASLRSICGMMMGKKNDSVRSIVPIATLSPPSDRQVCAARIIAGLSQDVCGEKSAKLLLERTAVQFGTEKTKSLKGGQLLPYCRSKIEHLQLFYSKIKPVRSPETSGSFYHAAERDITEYGKFHNGCHEKISSGP